MVRQVQLRTLCGYEFARIGSRLVRDDLLTGRFGNMSVRVDGGVLISRHGAYPDRYHHPVFVGDGEPAPGTASSEHRVHRRIYGKTEHLAVVHAHPPHAVAVSLAAHDHVHPVDSEGAAICPEIPVVDGAPGTDMLAEQVADALRHAPVAIARGHGTFAAGRTLDDAYLVTATTEHACRVIILSGGLRRA